MNTIDIVCLAFITLMILIGVWHGLFRGIFRLLAWAAAIAGAYFANKLFAVSVADSLSCSGFSASLICLCVGFLIPFLALLFAGHVGNKFISDTIVSKVDRILGAIFGAIKAVMIIFVVLTVMHVLPFGGVIKETRDTAVAYSLYKGTLETLGYSSDPIDLVDVAEKKATEITKTMTDKAAEKASEVAKEAADKATEAAKEAVSKAADEAKEAAKTAVGQASKKISSEKAQEQTASND